MSHPMDRQVFDARVRDNLEALRKGEPAPANAFENDPLARPQKVKPLPTIDDVEPRYRVLVDQL